MWRFCVGRAARLLVIAAVAAAILLPISMIESKVAERQARAEGVVQQFAAETSGPQSIAGPFLAIACEETVVDERQVMHEGKAETVREQKTLFFCLFVALYSALYVLLQSEDNALLMGSLMTFGVLAFAMLATRKLDWGSVSLSLLSPSRKAPA